MKDTALNVMIPEELKKDVKIEATKENNTIRTFVIIALRERLERIKNGI